LGRSTFRGGLRVVHRRRLSIEVEQRTDHAEHRLTLPDDPELARHASEAVARHNRGGWRIDKPNPRANIDAVIALAMAVERRAEARAGGAARMALRPCIGCGILIPGGSRCLSCTITGPRRRRLQAMRSAYVTGRPCVAYGAPAEHLDHITPEPRRQRSPVDLQPLCAACNLRKGDRGRDPPIQDCAKRPEPKGSCSRRSRLWLTSATILLLGTDHLSERLQPVRRLDAATSERRQQTSQQTCPVGDDPNLANLDDQA
jgi:hypothetical protein